MFVETFEKTNSFFVDFLWVKDLFLCDADDIALFVHFMDKAGAVAEMAGTAFFLSDTDEKRVLVAVRQHLDDILSVA